MYLSYIFLMTDSHGAVWFGRGIPHRRGRYCSGLRALNGSAAVMGSRRSMIRNRVMERISSAFLWHHLNSKLEKEMLRRHSVLQIGMIRHMRIFRPKKFGRLNLNIQYCNLLFSYFWAAVSRIFRVYILPTFKSKSGPKRVGLHWR